MKLLFITRTYPPAVGGLERVSYILSSELKKKVPTEIIAWGGPKIGLVWFLPKALAQAIYLVYARKITHIHLADGVLAPIGYALMLLTGRKVSLTANGLDVTYKNPFYQLVIPWCMRRLNHIICISNATKDECIKRGIPPEKCTFIPLGVYVDEFNIRANRRQLEQLVGAKLDNKKILISVGRLVRRKGVAWFVDKVMTRLDSNYVYFIIGDGVEKEHIQDAISEHKLGNRVSLLGKLSDSDVKLLYNTADIFIMPNIPVVGDMEGFGIVAIEAAAAGLPVVASDLEGIKDAVVEGKTGFLYPNQRTDLLIQAIKSAELLKKAAVKKEAREFSWDKVRNQYLQTIN